MAVTEVQRTGSDWKWTLPLSIFLHGSLLFLAIFGARLFPGLSLGGQHTGGAGQGAISATLVSNAGGAIPMPAPTSQPTENRLASTNPGATVAPPRVAHEDANSIALPANRTHEDLARAEAQRELERLQQADAQRKLDSRIAYGTGGAASFNYSMAGQGVGGGNGSMAFGDAAFGTMYAGWVNHLRDRLSWYWNSQYRDPNLPAGRLVFVTFTVQSDGTVGDIGFAQRSNVPELDSRALHTVEEMASKEKFPLPPGYHQRSLEVRVSFELQ
jgi:TonB family protein